MECRPFCTIHLPGGLLLSINLKFTPKMVQALRELNLVWEFQTKSVIPQWVQPHMDSATIFRNKMDADRCEN